MTILTATAVLAPVQFPAGSPAVSKIRYTLQQSLNGGTSYAGLMSIDVDPGLPGMFPGTQPPAMYRAVTVAIAASGAEIGSRVTSDPITVAAEPVTLMIPASVTLTAA